MTDRVLRFFLAITLLFSIYQSFTYHWLSDDAFISFTYARNLVEGNGLIYNIGETVEGYTNFLWTVGLAGGMKLGITPEIWAQYSGIFFYSLLWGFLAMVSRSQFFFVVFAWSFFRHGWYFATSGLETSMFTFLATAGIYFVLFSSYKKVGFWILLFSALTRPEGVYFYITAAAFSLYNDLVLQNGISWQSMRQAKMEIIRKKLHVKSIFFKIIMLHIPFLFLVTYYLWKIDYYGDLLPNTWYAKSGEYSYWSQGFYYIWLFIKGYPLLISILPIFIYFLWRGELTEQVLVVIISGYVSYIAKVGGDFMFARFLLPVLPLTFYLIGRFWLKIIPDTLRHKKSIIVFLGVLLTSIYTNPFRDANYLVHGITEERMFYRLNRSQLKYDTEIFHKLNIAFFGAQAHFMYYMKPALAIESQTGLTDRFIARQKASRRGVVGHEKLAPLSYLRQRNVNLVLADAYPELKGNDKNFYYHWNGQKLTFKILLYDPIKFNELKHKPGIDFTEAERKYRQIAKKKKYGTVIDFSLME